MDVKRSLIAISITSVLLAGVWTTASAKTAEEEDSVYRWGRWAVLAPAAGNEEVVMFTPAGTNDLGRCEAAENCPSPNPPPPQPPVVEGPCEAGKPCGFARIDYRSAGSAQAYDRHVGMIDLFLDDGQQSQTSGSVQYTITGPSAPDGETVVLDSGPLPANIGAAGFRSTARGNPSSISGRFTLNDAEDVAVVEGPWRQIGPEGAYAHSGEYVWGITATADQMSTLMDQLGGSLGGDLLATYAGPTATGGTIDLGFNFSRDTWTGTVHGTTLNFDAGGTIVNSNFVSDPAQFSSNVATGDLQGAFVNAGNNAIGGFEVQDHQGLRDADIFNATLQTGAPQ